MRKFLVEMDYVISMEDVIQEWEEWEQENMTFPQYLADCLGKNGALTEILTEDTPPENRKNAVIPCRVWYSDDVEDCFETWLTEQGIAEHELFATKIDKGAF